MLAKEQINFINGLCMPLYKTLVSVFPTIKPCLEQMSSNKKSWEERLKVFYSENEEVQNKTSDRSLWKEDEEKGQIQDVNHLSTITSLTIL